MAKYVRFENDQDLIWLQNIIHRYVERVKQDPQHHLGDQVETILRIDEALQDAKEPKDAGQLGVPKKALAVNKEADAKKPAKKKGSSKPVRVELCDEHPYYGAKQVPGHKECEKCWDAYKKMNPEKYRLKRNAYKASQRAQRRAK